MPIRTRFAPSPTGSLHVGGVRTALYCLLLARSTGGSFVLRIEDTDRARSTEESYRGILRDLRWLGLQWDEGPDLETPGPHGPYLQSQRLDLYNRYVDELLEKGVAYLAWETPQELETERKAALAAKQDWHYRRRDYTPEDLARFQAEGRTPVVRLQAPDHAITVTDGVLGEVTLEAEKLDDIVIRKADGFPTYHFAVVVDDHHMQIDLVLRGQEHLMNTHKHVGVYEALAWEPTPTAHLPLILNPDGSKMSKRDKARTARDAARRARDAEGLEGWDWLAERASLPLDDVVTFMDRKHDGIVVAEAIAQALDIDLPMIDVLDFRKGGYVPEALVNYLALLGWSPGDDREVLTLDEMIEAFSLDRVNHTAARFDPVKLAWLNGETIRRLSVEALHEHMASWMEVVTTPLARATPEQRTALLRMYQPRMQTFAEMDKNARFFFEAPTSWEKKAADKHLLKGGGLDRLEQAATALMDVGRWEAESIERTLQLTCDQAGVKIGRVAQPLRVAVSGQAVTPPIFDVLAFLGRDETLERIKRCVAHFR